MNSFELIPTEENLIHTLDKDLLKRNKDLVRFYDLILVQEGASSIAIDGRWGSGKTFFVKQSMLLINAKNPMSDMDDEKKASIVYALPFSKKAEDMPENYDVAVYYDAWENDNGTDPVLSLVYEIIKQLGINYAFDDNSNAFKLAGSVLEALTGRNINGIIENLKSDNPLTKIKEEKDLHENIKNFFTELLVERGNRLVVFIDELDRCKPSYAVQLLERIKHYLYDDRITFVFSVNLGELQHTIKHYYGNTFDACRYLDRFFDMRISLPPADKTAFYGFLDADGSETFSFPEDTNDAQKYKQFGNSVSIPVIKTMADFMLNCFDILEQQQEEIVKALAYQNAYITKKAVMENLGINAVQASAILKKLIEQQEIRRISHGVSTRYVNANREDDLPPFSQEEKVLEYAKENDSFSNKDIVELLQITVGSGNVLLSTMVKKGLLIRVKRGWYSAKV